VTTSAAITSRYPLSIHCNSAREAPRSWWIDGSASATTVESSISTNRPMHDPASVHQGRVRSSRRSSGTRREASRYLRRKPGSALVGRVVLARVAVGALVALGRAAVAGADADGLLLSRRPLA